MIRQVMPARPISYRLHHGILVALVLAGCVEPRAAGRGSHADSNPGSVLEEGDVVGLVSAAVFMQYDNMDGGVPNEPQSSVAAAMYDFGEQVPIDPQLSVLAVLPPPERESIAGCVVETQTIVNTFELTGGGGRPTSEPPVIEAFPLDAGATGTAENASGGATLRRTDDAGPAFSGFYFSEQGSLDLTPDGSLTEQTVTFRFPGGTDIDAFEVTADVPPAPRVLMPDVTDPGLTIDLSGPINVVWEPGDAADTVQLAIFRLTILRNQQGDRVEERRTMATATCTFPDTGSGTIPAEALARLPELDLFTTLSVTRVRRSEIAVELPGAGVTGIVQAVGSARVSHSFLFLSGASPCDLATCGEGLVCNPDVGFCQPAGDEP